MRLKAIILQHVVLSFYGSIRDMLSVVNTIKHTRNLRICFIPDRKFRKELQIATLQFTLYYWGEKGFLTIGSKHTARHSYPAGNNQRTTYFPQIELTACSTQVSDYPKTLHSITNYASRSYFESTFLHFCFTLYLTLCLLVCHFTDSHVFLVFVCFLFY